MAIRQKTPATHLAQCQATVSARQTWPPSQQHGHRPHLQAGQCEQCELTLRPLGPPVSAPPLGRWRKVGARGVRSSGAGCQRVSGGHGGEVPSPPRRPPETASRDGLPRWPSTSLTLPSGGARCSNQFLFLPISWARNDRHVAFLAQKMTVNRLL